MKSVLVAGYTTRHVAASATRAGYEVYAVDHFCDQDLIWCTKDHRAFDELSELPFVIEEMFNTYDIDHVITTSGAELLQIPNRLGTPRNVAKRFMDKGKTQDFFEEIGVPVPKRLGVGEYPAMMKTLAGAGGWRNACINSDEELLAWKEFVDHLPYIAQEPIAGHPASVSCLSTGSEAMALCANEQILRGGETCAYAFSGSLTPCKHPLADRMMDLAEKIVAESGCVGSVGVDFVLTDTEAYAIEINPRFQGTVETVEASLGVNLFSLHVDACRGILPEKRPEPICFAVRRILPAPKTITIKKEMSVLRETITDIPHPGTSFEEGEVMFSVTGSGESRENAFSSLDKHIRDALQLIKE
ncbi:MAG TPA: ATP-grasp domain-containing protein [Methanocorpusculum sp.]|nr:ATP-grasp domain-containing protein [Methanocorpusculum sp.]HJJ53291.1 ATP-grasp domain-containing protein [Methanocorpusculum sp.]